MLRELHISNLAVIEDLSLEFDDRFNCFTGQTGAGKSLILGAFEIMLGLRSGGLVKMIRPGVDEARVSGVFEIRDPWIVKRVGQVLDLTLEAGEVLLISRKIFASGRTSVSVNGQPSTAAMVRSIGQLLVDVHGQHDHQYLLKPSNQLTILDAYGQCLDMRDRFVREHGQLRRLINRRRTLAASQALRGQQLELYEFQGKEIDAVAPDRGELAQLQVRYDRLSNLKRLKQEAGQAYAALYEMDGSIAERLQVLAHLLLELGELDEQLGPVAEQVRASTLSLQESAYELGRYVDRLELDPAELGEVEDRLNSLNRLLSKYVRQTSASDDPVADLLEFRAQIEQSIGELRRDNEDLDNIERDIAAATASLETLGKKLSQARRRAAEKLVPLVEAELGDLGMTDVTLVVEFEPSGREEAATTGMERVEMYVRTNPGQPARPLRKIASGGELSRIMLALKSILAHADRISVLVFDEIDANVGGRMGTEIGRKLRQLTTVNESAGSAAAGSHQVLCITHLPQIAAFADRHLRIDKRVDTKGKSKQTRIRVTILDAKKRVKELAEMLAGKGATRTTHKQAREMLEAAIDQKSVVKSRES